MGVSGPLLFVFCNISLSVTLFVVANHMTSIVLGQYREKKLMYKKHVALSVNNEAFAEIKTQPPRATAPFVGNVPANHGNGMRRANEKTVTGLTPSPA